MSNLGLGISVLTFTVVFLALCAVIQIDDRRSKFYAGLVLALFGLFGCTASAVFVDLLFYNENNDVYDFRVSLLSNSYLIIASIGANLFATALCTKEANESFSLYRRG
ncbi:hypothetical protein KUK79_004484 [Vibrio parahaemolyticus]|nr:hypothetical protein [Vibrio parahaemolyticus]